jgi:hypothetical protein
VDLISPCGLGFLFLSLMGLNLSNLQIAQKLDLNQDDVLCTTTAIAVWHPSEQTCRVPGRRKPQFSGGFNVHAPDEDRESAKYM